MSKRRRCKRRKRRALGVAGDVVCGIAKSDHSSFDHLQVAFLLCIVWLEKSPIFPWWWKISHCDYQRKEHIESTAKKSKLQSCARAICSFFCSGILRKACHPTFRSRCRFKAEEQSSSIGARKKVTFDANVKTYEHVLPEEIADILPETVEDGEEEKEEHLVKSSQSQTSSEVSSIASSSGSYPPNHRYQNCRESDDELDYEDSDLDEGDEDDDGMLDYYDMYEDDNDVIVESRIAGRKLDSKEIDSSMVTTGLNDGVKPIMVNRTARVRRGYAHCVLNPVENLTQWKALKAKEKPQLKHQKENFTADDEPQRASFSIEQGFKELSLSFKSKPEHESKKANQEKAADACCSNWLSSSVSAPINKSSSTVSLSPTPEKIKSQGSANSSRSQGDRSILDALTLEEMKQFSASCSPRKSPSRSPDEMPIIGTVGIYRSPTRGAKDSGSTSSYKGIPNTTSKYSGRI